MVLEIPDKLPTWNIFYGGISHHERTRMKNKWILLTLEALGSDYTMFEKPVHITVWLECKRVAQDADNCCPKLVIDVLKGKLLVDDSPLWVYGVTYYTRKSNRDHTTILLEEVDERVTSHQGPSSSR